MDFERSVVFKVQVGAFKNKDLSKYFDNNPNFGGEAAGKDSTDPQRITIGIFRDYWEADTFKKYMRDMGVKDAWIVLYMDGARVEIKDAGRCDGGKGESTKEIILVPPKQCPFDTAFLFSYFCIMLKVGAFVFIFFFAGSLAAQVRLSKLELKFKEVYALTGTDILVVDTLILHDSSRIMLNHLKRDNFIHARFAIFHRGSMIDGKGVQGLPGRVGRAGTSPKTPCSDGQPGVAGTNGTNGGDGINLSLYLTEMTVVGKLLIDISGGAGGDGSAGGTGGGGGPGTRLCKAGSGGQGAPGSNGGNGGRGGNLILNAPRIPELRLMIGEKIIVRNYGGDPGLSGDGGRGGPAGLSPVGNRSMDGNSGKKGAKGKDGQTGKLGSILFQDK